MGALLFATNGSSGELAGVVDRFNPLVSSGEVYVKTKEANAIEDHGVARYIQSAADSNGNIREIEFIAGKELTQGKYLKVFNKGAHVETYEEVAESDVPASALKALG